MIARGTFAALGLALAACREPAPPSARPAPPGPPAQEVRVVDAATIPPVALAEADCRAFSTAPALGIAVVTSGTPDCSGVGHLRIVLDVRRLARGANITRIVTSRPLVGPERGELAVGDTVVVAIDPAVRPAETVYCVALPAHEGTVRHALPVGSLADAERVIDAIAAGRACPGGARP